MSDGIEVDGVVAASHRSDRYEVDVLIGTTTKRVLARRSGRLVQHWIRLVEGDRVRVELSPYDLSRGRITRRLDGRQGAA